MTDFLTTIPTFERVTETDGKINPPTRPGVARWGMNYQPAPPAIGAHVVCIINRIGSCVVKGYFVDSDYLGVVADVLNPPEWFVKQNGNRREVRLFGTEIKPSSDPLPVAAVPELPVLFRFCRGELVAYFPTLPGDSSSQTMACYAHVGQHSAASVVSLTNTRPAFAGQYGALLNELRGIYELGDDPVKLKPISRMAQWMHDERRRELGRSRAR